LMREWQKEKQKKLEVNTRIREIDTEIADIDIQIAKLAKKLST